MNTVSKTTKETCNEPGDRTRTEKAQTNMRIIIDTVSGLALAEKNTLPKEVKAVVLGRGAIPESVGQREGNFLWLRIDMLRRLFDTTVQKTCYVKSLIKCAKQRGDLRIVSDIYQLKVEIIETSPRDADGH